MQKYMFGIMLFYKNINSRNYRYRVSFLLYKSVPRMLFRSIDVIIFQRFHFLVQILRNRYHNLLVRSKLRLGRLDALL